MMPGKKYEGVPVTSIAPMSNGSEESPLGPAVLVAVTAVPAFLVMENVETPSQLATQNSHVFKVDVAVEVTPGAVTPLYELKDAVRVEVFNTNCHGVTPLP
jgi:hypothetical protein